MHKINKQIGQRVRWLRQEKGFTQEGLAETTGLHRAHVGAIERGEVDVSVVTLQRIGHGLHMSVAALLKGVGVSRG